MSQNSNDKRLNTVAKIIEEVKNFGAEKRFIFRGENRDYPKMATTLYREQIKNIKELPLDNKEEIISSLYFPKIQQEILEKAKRHFATNSSDFEILTQLQHYQGKTNLIDFSRNILIALFFACDGNLGKDVKDGYLYCLEESFFEKGKADKEINYQENTLLEPYDKNNRVIFQQSIFIHCPNGFLDKKDLKKIVISGKDKKNILDELKKNYDIHTDTIYNDLQGFIKNSKNFQTAETYFYIGLSFQNKGEYEKAIENYNEAIKINPNLLAVYYNRGVLKNELKLYDEAIEDYTEVIRINPSFIPAYNERALLKKLLGEYQEAIKDYTKVIGINSNDAEAYCKRGLLKTELSPDLKNAPKDKKLIKEVILLYQDAYEDFEKALGINPNLKDALEAQKLSGNMILEFTQELIRNEIQNEQ